MKGVADFRYYVVVPPGFEDLSVSECLEKVPDFSSKQIVNREKGGFEVVGDAKLGYALNRFLRLPTRILLRLNSGSCKNFDQLRGFITKVDWPQYIGGVQPKWKISTAGSKLYHRERIEDVAARSLRSYYRDQLKVELPKKVQGLHPMEVHIRLQDNHLEISLDISGEELFKRGVKTLKSLAPIRENLAYGILRFVLEDLGNPTNFTVFDPMCGTGTFLLEAGLYGQALQRQSVFSELPFVQSKPFNPPPNPVSKNNVTLLGWDRHPKMCEQVTTDLKNILPKETYFRIQVNDLFEASVKPELGAPSLIVCNPPYGERLELPLPKKIFWPRLFETLAGFGADRFGFIIPRDNVSQLPSPKKFIDFKNGALPVRFLLFEP